MGGVIGGISGYRADNGSYDYVLRDAIRDESYVDNYDPSGGGLNKDEFLNERIFKMHRVKKGDYNITELTTTAPPGYRMITSGDYVNPKGQVVAGSMKNYGSEGLGIYISPNTTMSNDVIFRAVTGHELLHAYHIYAIPGASLFYSERAAYRYTFDTYLKHGYFNDAIATLNTAKGWGGISAYPAAYHYSSSPFLKLW